MQVDTTALGLDAERYRLCRICSVHVLGKCLVITFTLPYFSHHTKDII
jgi:hypothetical protein